MLISQNLPFVANFTSLGTVVDKCGASIITPLNSRELVTEVVAFQSCGIYVDPAVYPQRMDAVNGGISASVKITRACKRTDGEFVVPKFVSACVVYPCVVL